MFDRRAFRSRQSRALRCALVLSCLGLVPVSSPGQSPEDVREYQKKAEFIASFTRFVDWPARKFAQPDSPFVIGVWGTDTITSLLQEAIQGRPIKGRPAVIKHLTSKQELRACHVLFISRSERDRLGPILGEVRRENVLTVGECDNFLSRGGVVNFVTIGSEIRFQISTDAANREKLSFSSRLLQLAVPLSQVMGLPAGAVRLGDATIERR